MKKTIFIIITKSFLTRNILRSGTLEYLKKAGHNIVIFFDCKEIPDYLKNEFEDKQVRLFALHASVSRIHRLFIRIDRYLVCTKSTKSIIYYGISPKVRRKRNLDYIPKQNIVISHFRYALAWFLSRIWIARKLFRYIEQTLFLEKDEQIRKYFEQFKPDIVLSTSVISGLDIAMMKEAKRSKITTVALPKTWDNLTNLYYRFAPDYFIVQNKILADIAVWLQNFDRKKVFIVGVPQFDWYRKEDIIKSRAEHFKTKGLNPDLPLIFFGSSGVWSASDNRIAEVIYEWIKNNELAKKCQLLLRPHFTNCRNDIFKNFRGKPNVVVDGYRMSSNLIDNWDPTIEETIDFTNSVAHCDIMINLASSLALDAACADRPVINPGFGGTIQEGKDVTAFAHYGTDHYSWVLDTNATLVSNSEEELKNHINTYLLHPELKSEEREVLREKLCYKVDGKSSERLAQAINNILQK